MLPVSASYAPDGRSAALSPQIPVYSAGRYAADAIRPSICVCGAPSILAHTLTT